MWNPPRRAAASDARTHNVQGWHLRHSRGHAKHRTSNGCKLKIALRGRVRRPCIYRQASIDVPFSGMKSVANQTLAVFPPTTTARMLFGLVKGFISVSPGTFFQLA